MATGVRILGLLQAAFAAWLLPAPAAWASAPAHRTLACVPRVVLLARGFGSPDDVAVQGRRILFTDQGNGSLAAEAQGRVTVLARGLDEPEGIVVEGKNRVLVAEQGLNRIDEIDPRNGRRTVVVRLPNGTGQMGVDGIAPAPNGGVYIPDSPNGRLLLLDRRRRLHVLITGLGRPVGAIGWAGGVAVADETDRAVWLVRGGRATRLATLPVPDDVAVVNGHLLAVSLNDGRLWEISPHVTPLVSGLGQPQGLATLRGGSVVVANSPGNALYRISGLAGCS